MAAIGCVGKQVLRQVTRRQPQVTQALGGEGIGQGRFSLPPTERAMPARAGHCDGGMSVGGAAASLPLAARAAGDDKNENTSCWGNHSRCIVSVVLNANAVGGNV